MRRYLLIALVCSPMLAMHLWKRDIEPQLAPLPMTRPGCQADLLVGWVDCMTVFEDGTFIHTRGY